MIWAPIALRLLVGALQLKLDPLVLGRHGVLVQQEPSVLVGNDDVERAAIPEIGQGNRATVGGVGDSDRLGHVHKLACAVIEPKLLGLISGQATAFECRPVLGVSDDGAVAAGNFGKVVPVATVAISEM